MFDRHFEQISTNGITLNTVVEGDGPLVIMLHGFPQCSFLWRHQIDPVIEAGFRVAVPDQRGYGGSDVPGEVGAYNIRELAADAAGIATALGHDDFIVVGHDWGAVVAWNTALLHADRCRAVMGMAVPYFRSTSLEGFTDPPGMDDSFWYIRYFQEPGVAEAELDANVRAGLLATYYTISGDSPPGAWMAQLQHPRDSTLVDALQTPEQLPPWLSEDELTYYVQQFERSGFFGPVSWYRNGRVLGEVGLELGDKPIGQPAAFIVGSEDDVLKYQPGVDMVEAMKPWFSDLRFATVVEGAGHWVQVERPAEATAELLRFLNDVR